MLKRLVSKDLIIHVEHNIMVRFIIPFLSISTHYFFRVKRGGSRGFVLRDETVDEEFLKESLEAEQKWLGRFRLHQPTPLQRRDSSTSSRYSFSTDSGNNN